ncbi:hypothetical protein CFC21_080281 [Triticum aestivum]|uniref:Uncharacterized protein n=2 Tax=Triticum aestivum TaxID=4565 RepID=A0A9R1I0T2_WHEAT|nr:protein LURP1-like [Triticum aestivum]KAF7075507.1 hypothetical protein CFC21_080281 [Triticum aestivum]
MDQAAAGNGVTSGPLKLTLTRRVPGLFDRKLHVTDGQGSLVFRTVSVRPAFNFRLRTALADASGNHLMRFRRKWMGSHHGWQVFRGESFDPNNLAFTVEPDKRFQINATMKLFLAANSTRQRCDYRVQGSFLTKSLKVYKGDSSQVVAQMVKEKPAFSIGGKGYTISVNQNEDLELILVFLAIRHEKFRVRRMNLYTMGIAHAVNAAAGLFF